MMVAEITWKGFTPASRSQVSALLKLNPDLSTWIVKVPKNKHDQTAFAKTATWPDAINKKSGYTDDGDTPPAVPASQQNIGYLDHLQHRYWHFIDVPFLTDGTPLIPPKSPNAETEIEMHAVWDDRLGLSQTSDTRSARLGAVARERRQTA